jgi:hypothetical protein
MEGVSMRANRRTAALLCLTVSVTFLGCPIPADKDERLEGEWNGIMELWIVPWPSVIEARVTVSEGRLTVETPGQDPISGEYFVFTRFDPMWIDWHTPAGLIRGTYEFGVDTLTIHQNGPREPRPAAGDTPKTTFEGVRVK